MPDKLTLEIVPAGQERIDANVLKRIGIVVDHDVTMYGGDTTTYTLLIRKGGKTSLVSNDSRERSILSMLDLLWLWSETMTEEQRAAVYELWATSFAAGPY